MSDKAGDRYTVFQLWLVQSNCCLVSVSEELGPWNREAGSSRVLREEEPHSNPSPLTEVASQKTSGL